MGSDDTGTCTSTAISSVSISDLQIIHSHNGASLDTYQEVNGKRLASNSVGFWAKMF